MIAKSVAVTVALVLVASASQAQMAPTNIDQAIYVNCRQAHAMNLEARKALAMETLDNLGVVKADAAGIAYAIERGWLVISGGLHSVSLTEARPATGKGTYDSILALIGGPAPSIFDAGDTREWLAGGWRALPIRTMAAGGS